ncbi:hypothetical protein WMY93_029860 [Mugilogobius chulae]|uniref:Uncharacterized protein n=1 Tax=Mugilogobius chulae TaxID=88201 RepID=A0AAW0MXU2_9GOBI
MLGEAPRRSKGPPALAALTTAIEGFQGGSPRRSEPHPRAPSLPFRVALQKGSPSIREEDHPGRILLGVLILSLGVEGEATTAPSELETHFIPSTLGEVISLPSQGLEPSIPGLLDRVAYRFLLANRWRPFG